VAGSATRFRAFDSAGVLSGQGTSINGVAKRIRAFNTTGALNGPGSAIVGASSIVLIHDTTGVLAGPGAAVNGTSNHISLYPNPADVRDGVQYGPGGIYTGTLTVGVGSPIIRLRSFTEET